MTAEKFHIPVLLEESIAGLALQPGGTYVDLTFGGGGHSKRILSELVSGRLVAFDQDPDVAGCQISDKRFRFINHNFRYMKNFLDYYKIGRVDGVLADLGVSSHQLDEAKRGFSYRYDAVLDMRMNPGIKESARDIVNDAGRERLVSIFRQYGELARPGAWADLIIRERSKNAINTTGQLALSLKTMLRKGRENKELAKLFQALRIEVNNEMNGLKEMLHQCIDCIKMGGRLVVISYHSVEDRLVKNFINTGNTEGEVRTDFYGNRIAPFKAIEKKLIVPGDNEIKTNPRSRSAKLRIAERIDNGS